MTGVDADILKFRLFAMDNANGSSRDLDQWLSMFQKAATISFATASCHQMRLSAMVLTNNYTNGERQIIEDSGVLLVCYHFGAVSRTGCTLSTSELL